MFVENKKILPFRKPIISYSPNMDNFLSVLENDHNITLPWILEHYIDLIIRKDEINPPVFEFLDYNKIWWTCPFVHVSRIDREAFSVYEDFQKAIRNLLQKNFYIFFLVDTFYVDGIQRKIGYRLLIDRARVGDPIEVWGDSSRVKDMVYVKDFCQMLYKALFVNRKCGYYNVGTGVGTSLLDQIKGMIEVFGEDGRKSEIIMRPDKPNAPQYIMDITPAKEELGYKPKYNYLDMLRDFKREMQNVEVLGEQ